MNHIFYKLANDAWIDAPDGKGYAGKIFSKEKFAELIVAECISVVRQNYVDRGTTEAVIAIEEHFGVDQ